MWPRVGTAQSRPHIATYHLSVVGIVCLFNEWEFLPSQGLEDGYHLGKLQKTRKNFIVSSTSGPDKTSICQINNRAFFSVEDIVLNKLTKLRKERYMQFQGHML